jgi:hypothetical protein
MPRTMGALKVHLQFDEEVDGVAAPNSRILTPMMTWNTLHDANYRGHYATRKARATAKTPTWTY